MPVVHSLTAPAPAPAPAMRPLRRTTTAACTSGESSRPPQALPELPSRRAALLALVLAASPPARPAAAAFSLGIRTNRFPIQFYSQLAVDSTLTRLFLFLLWDGAAGPKELLREQKKKSARFLLAPIAASREILLKTQGILASENVGAGDAEEVGRLVGAAGRDCVPRQRNSIVAFQSRTGVEVGEGIAVIAMVGLCLTKLQPQVCTFSLILKNAASLLTDKDPLKVEADARLAELTQSLSDLGTVLDNSNFEVTADREKIKDGLLSTVAAIDKFEQSVKDCLGI
uniref:Uncharacterized protein n=1 Tax=Leersia perrieri TaxID=77586 RepID=A0A0D9VZK9_9ORYZ